MASLFHVYAAIIVAWSFLATVLFWERLFGASNEARLRQVQ
jgi:hypothetical protein